MIDGGPKELIDGLYFGDERFFYFRNRKYFIQGYYKNGKPLLELYVIEPSNDNFKWKAISQDASYPVSEFENTAIFDGKTFWQIENKIKWVDD